MNTRKLSTLLLATAATLGVGIGSAFAQTGPNAGGYVYPDFWGTQASQPVAQGNGGTQANSDAVGTYATHTENNGTWLFPPDPWGGGNG